MARDTVAEEGRLLQDTGIVRNRPKVEASVPDGERVYSVENTL